MVCEICDFYLWRRQWKGLIVPSHCAERIRSSMWVRRGPDLTHFSPVIFSIVGRTREQKVFRAVCSICHSVPVSHTPQSAHLSRLLLSLTGDRSAVTSAYEYRAKWQAQIHMYPVIVFYPTHLFLFGTRGKRSQICFSVRWDIMNGWL